MTRRSRPPVASHPSQQPLTVAVSGGWRSAWLAYRACARRGGPVTLVHVYLGTPAGLRTLRACVALVQWLRRQYGDAAVTLHEIGLNVTPGCSVPQLHDIVDFFVPRDAVRADGTESAVDAVADLGDLLRELAYCEHPPDCGQCAPCREIAAAREA